MEFAESESWRERLPTVNDGIIATAGVIEGFLAAGAGTTALFTASLAATVAGAGALAGVTYSATAARRDAELTVIAAEMAELESDPEAELHELSAYYESKGVEPALAREVAAQISARDALSAQLDVEHGIREPTAPSAPLIDAAFAAVAFVAGAALPIIIALVSLPHARAAASAIAVLVALTITAFITARVSRVPVWRTIVRALIVGVVALTLSILGGSLLPDPDGPEVGAAPQVDPTHLTMAP